MKRPIVIIERGVATVEIRHGEVTLRCFGLAANPTTFDTPRTLRAGDSLASR